MDVSERGEVVRAQRKPVCPERAQPVFHARRGISNQTQWQRVDVQANRICASCRRMPHRLRSAEDNVLLTTIARQKQRPRRLQDGVRRNVQTLRERVYM